MPVFSTPVTRQEGQLSSSDLMGMYEKGQAQRQTDYSNLALRNIAEHDKDENTRWGITQLTDTSKDSTALATALKPQMERYKAALLYQNQATGRRMSEQEIDKEVENYFSRYFLWKQNNPQVGENKDTGTTKATTPPVSSGEGVLPPGEDRKPTVTPFTTTSKAIPMSQVLNPDGTFSGVKPSAAPMAIGKMSPDDIVNAAQDPESAGYVGILGQDMQTQAKAIIAKEIEALKKLNLNSLQLKTLMNDSRTGAARRQAIVEYLNTVQSKVPDGTGVGVFPSQGGYGTAGFKGFAEGGTADQGPQLALIGEGGEDEYVVPQSKAVEWARRVLDDPSNIPNPRDLQSVPQYKDGAEILGSSGYQSGTSGVPMQRPPLVDPNAQAANAFFTRQQEQAVQPQVQSQQSYPAQIPPPQGSPTAGDIPRSAPPAASASPASSATPSTPPIDAKKVAFDLSQKQKMEDVDLPTEEFATKVLKVPVQEVIGDDQTMKKKGFIEKAVVSAKHRMASDVLSQQMRTPEFRDTKAVIDKDFKTWFKEATPEELSLWRGMEGAAGHRANSNELALKWKYYKLQEDAAAGDQGATKMKDYLDFALKYLDMYKDSAKDKGVASVAASDPLYLTMFNFVGSALGINDQEVIKTWYGKNKLAPAKVTGQTPLLGTAGLSQDLQSVLDEVNGVKK